MAVAPKRRRGRERVEAILSAAAQIFAQKGYAGATMSEIARSSGTAVGSLYRFFPEKSALADALLSRYAERVDADLGALAARSAGLSAPELAAQWVALMTDLGEDRAVALALLDASRDAVDRRLHLRALMRGHVNAMLAARAPGLPAPRRAAAAALLLHISKAVPLAAREPAPLDRDLRAEAQNLLAAALERLEAATPADNLFTGFAH
ncbi:TetR/AcrR family transcriptional regulator [Paroceanicella profunda]|nr:TetR/AcrR family transcriptional regulator [Paroceanicella profunda]